MLGLLDVSEPMAPVDLALEVSRPADAEPPTPTLASVYGPWRSSSPPRKLNITLTSTSVPGVPLAVHTFTNTDDMVNEIIDARIYSGFHYRTSGVHGTVIGKKVAHWVSSHFFRPL